MYDILGLSLNLRNNDCIIIRNRLNIKTPNAIYIIRTFDSYILKSIDFQLLSFMQLKNDEPNPTSMLKTGPAIEPDTPISPYPDFANAQFNVRSLLMSITWD